MTKIWTTSIAVALAWTNVCHAGNAEQRSADPSSGTMTVAFIGTPTITVSASPTEISQGEDATFTVTIWPTSSRQLAVNFFMNGTAALGEDYMLIGNFNKAGQLIVPSGQSSTTVTLHSLVEDGDDGRKAGETAVFNLLHNKQYRTGTPKSATIRIQL